MKGDFTRFRFDPGLHRRRVYDQQGRVALDADANEGVDVAEYLREVGVGDVVGPSGGPLTGAGFEITAAGAELEIGAGRYWVDGLLVENESATTTLLSQPYLPAGTSPVSKEDGTVDAPPNDGVYIVLLETWERLLTAAEDDSQREAALGGPDTTARTQQVWQVRLLRAGNVGTPFTCSASLPAWTTLTGPPAVTMAAHSAVSKAPPNDCTVPAAAGFRGTENQHYRVEIHDAGAVDEATFLWSRENGSVVTRWTARSGNDLTVSSPGRDGSLGFAPGDWVELIDETRELTGQPGTLVRLNDARGDHLVIDAATATGTVDIETFPRNPRVRRWDSDGPQTLTVPSTNDGWLPLELGVEVHWPSSGTFRTGQWWAVPARTVLGDVIWPLDGSNPAMLAPLGDQHHFTRLAIAQLEAGTWKVLSDCRTLFPPLTALESLFMLGGDGQEALPDMADPSALVPLAAPLRVGVAKGTTPVPNATVQFSVTAGNGRVNDLETAPVATGPDGVASVSWSVDSANALQTVTAQLVDDLGNPLHLPVQFDATLSVASDVAYDPSACAELAGTKTVQQAIDKLCAVGGEGCATIVLSPGENWQAPLLELADGADAHICFRPGTYMTAEPVVLAKKGSLIVSGSALGSRVVAPQSEIVLFFQDCAQIVVRDLAVESGRVGIKPERPGLNGALTLEGCRQVHVEGVRLACAAGVARAGACLTARASASTRPEVVRVRDCELVVGHMQVGALVLDAEASSISGTTIRVAPQPASLTFDALLADSARRAALARQLFGRARASGEAAVGAEGFSTKLSVAGYTVAFDSSVPQAEWQKYAETHPPTTAQTGSTEGLQQWAAALASQAVSEPTRLPTFQRHVQSLQRQIGPSYQEVITSVSGQTLLHSTLIASPIVVVDPATRPGAGERLLQLGTSRVRFDSVLSVADWQNLLSAGGVTAVSSGVELKQRMDELARKAVVTPELRAQVPALVSWFTSLSTNNVPSASTGIVVGGAIAKSVSVFDNELSGVAEAVHVGVSAGGAKVAGAQRQAGRVEIRGNRAAMSIPFELELGARAFFVGNVGHAVIADNDMRLDTSLGKRSAGALYREGIRVWGMFGPSVRIDDNLLAGCLTGVRVQPRSAPPTRSRWSVSGNVAPNAHAAVAAPANVVRSENVP